MGEKENCQGASNTKRKPFRKFYKKASNGKNNATSSKPKSTVREYKFHMHDTDARKSSESFGKIKEEIILKIQKYLN